MLTVWIVKTSSSCIEHKIVKMNPLATIYCMGSRKTLFFIFMVSIPVLWFKAYSQNVYLFNMLVNQKYKLELINSMRRDCAFFVCEYNSLGMWAHLGEDEVSDKHEEESRHESREQGGDEPGCHWRGRRKSHQNTVSVSSGSQEWVLELSCCSRLLLFFFSSASVHHLPQLVMFLHTHTQVNVLHSIF